MAGIGWQKQKWGRLHRNYPSRSLFVGGCHEHDTRTNPKTGLFEASVIVGPLSLSNPAKFRMHKKQKSVLPERSLFILKFSILFLVTFSLINYGLIPTSPLAELRGRINP